MAQHRTADLKRLELILEEFRKIDPEMQMQKAMAFLAIAERDAEGREGQPLTIMALGERLGLAPASASRNVGVLTAGKDFKGREGHGLVAVEEDPSDRRARVLRLTPKGKRVMSTIKSLMEG
jgi:DNA-binding MarR family transcriptional regulator